MRVHQISWIAFWFVGLAMFSASDEARCQVPRGHFTNVINLGPNVNSSAVDTSPQISADGLTLYFSSTRGGGGFDLYQATRPTVNDAFGDVMNLGPGINSSATDSAPSISFDGLTLYFSSNRSGGEGRGDLYQATRPTAKDAFGDVMNLGPTINTRYSDGGGHISPDGLTLYFESDRPGGKGRRDLYTATRENVSDPFASVTNLGSGINGSTDDSGATVSSDGLVMFFSDRFASPFRPGSQGLGDIWVAVRTSTDEPFGDVVNLDSFSLGSDVNDTFNDLVPSISHDWPAVGSQLYFQSRPAGGVDLWQATWVPEPMLQAGDANQNLSFDQFDIVQVSQGAKYLTGQPATWGQGDWDGAPGGSPGNPPVGNGTFDQLDIIAALTPGHYLTGPYAAVEAGGERGDGQTSVGYHAATGELWVDAPAGTELTSINIDSAAGIFTGDAAQGLGGSFDNDADGNIFKATFGSSFASLSFGNVAQPGLSQEFVLSDLTVVGSLAGGGDLGNVDLIYVPEPSTIGILVIGMLLGVGCLRRTD